MHPGQQTEIGTIRQGLPGMPPGMVRPGTSTTPMPVEQNQYPHLVKWEADETLGDQSTIVEFF